MSQQPLWIAALAALLTPTIAVFGAWIAYQQWRLGQNKLKLDLFDRRFVVYEGARSLLRTILTSGRAKDEDLFAFLNATSTAKWLFSPGVDDYLRKTMYHQAVKLAQLHAELEGVGIGEERTRNVREQRAVKEWFLLQQVVLDEHFSKFLRLAHEA
jgi:hypothetical protein